MQWYTFKTVVVYIIIILTRLCGIQILYMQLCLFCIFNLNFGINSLLFANPWEKTLYL